MSEPSKQYSGLVGRVASILAIKDERAATIVAEAERLYVVRMRDRFSQLRVRERLKRTNPFLLRIRGATTVLEWATYQVEGALYASEEEAVGHVLEMIAKHCYPGAQEPRSPADLDFEAVEGQTVYGYQVKMSWDCMPMSSRKNLSNTVNRLRESFATEGTTFVGVFAPCYGKTSTTKQPGQEYLSMGSRDFWTKVGNGDREFDVKVGEVCALLCAEFRREIKQTLLPQLIAKLSQAAQPEIGDSVGGLDYSRLFRRINP